MLNQIEVQFLKFETCLLIISFVVEVDLFLLECFHVGRSRPGWGKEMCESVWWPTGVLFLENVELC